MSLHTFTPTKEEFQQYYSIPFSVFFVEVETQKGSSSLAHDCR